MDPKAKEHLEHWKELHQLYPNGVCPVQCQCMGDGWYAMCDGLEARMERFHDDIEEWSVIDNTPPPIVPTKPLMMNVAGRSYWNYREETDNSDKNNHRTERIFRQDLHLPPCVHNQMSENIDLILLDLHKMVVEKVAELH